MNTVQEAKNTIQFEEIEVPPILVNYLEKKTQRTTYIPKNRYSVTDIVGCQRKSHFRAMGFEEGSNLSLQYSRKVRVRVGFAVTRRM